MHTVPTSFTGLPTFQCCLGYRPTLFTSLEEEVSLAQAFVRCCKRTWLWARARLHHSITQFKQQADCCHSTALTYCTGQRDMLSTRSVPIITISHKIPSRHIGPFTISKIINPFTVRQLLPYTIRCINPSFLVSQIKPLVSCPFHYP